ncbi:hypothetical protein QJS04_geneDACA008282 [Acorus gramineus]|uniref:Uncharacterized protein n=1 Tax=Acorus gramineus TaxID=55184 RepID=A0AAV9AZQ3_ACOGR|nr:hypothetical protein QJS04_geneDACA008282 [Acorus gramineus]
MKFSESPAVELRVGSTTLTIEQDNQSMHVGTSVWPCSLLLVKFAEHSLSSPSRYSDLLRFPGRRAVELGSGTGAAGMGLSLLGLSDIVLTDIDPVLPALKRNLKRNRRSLPPKLPRLSRLYWNNPDQIRSLKPPFDFVVATDVVYIEETVRPLVSAMEALVADDGLVLLGYQVRSPEADRLFWEVCAGSFDAERVPREDLHPDYAFEGADVFFLRKKR